eukprot:TRINITY_DN3171_c0_g1_i2.p1 TRINITY_DN3171_c0_g1~~TRINITY_DN3171_c0_g1_i2.p1  ORF type:complete len:140 (-),score=34.71 TRINITY_DN3171_c0_g1_i2:631-1005(-)
MDGEVLRFVIPSDDHTIFVTGISKQTTEEELFDMLSVYGPLYKVKIVEKEKSRSLTKVRFAFAKFYSLQHAKEAASEMKGIILHGSILNVKFSTSKVYDAEGSAKFHPLPIEKWFKSFLSFLQI